MIAEAWFGIIVGLSMVGEWALFYLVGNIPELENAPIAFSFHIAAELITAALLIVSGAGLLRRRNWARPLYLLALGMLFYTVIVSPGYFAQQGEWQWLLMFAAILLAGLMTLPSVVRDSQKTTI